ncbi:beta-N-acetylhexosaminidase [Luminiphilus sp. nBUS_16]|uniref:beta-N-acetylhexosaminidase n=1 Tax=Luminiphilus sp. nBUS_16 TaxID=3395315 RepID=UPI003EB95535
MLPAIFGLSGLTLTAEEVELIRRVDPLGFILFARNIENPQQVKLLTDALKHHTGRDNLPILIDQEGGRVARLGPPHWRTWPPALEFAHGYAQSPERGRAAVVCNYQALALDLAALGISVNCAPVLDVPESGAHDIIGDRAFGSEPHVVAELGAALLEGFAKAGVVGVIKHIPGHGRALADSHEALPRVTAPAEALSRDLAPFKALANAPMAMTAHIVYDAWDDQRCATLSPAVIREVIREQIGFDGLLMTDDLDMKALEGPVPLSGCQSLAAGCDVVLNCWGRMSDMRGLAEQLPVATAACQRRLSEAMSIWVPPPSAPEIAALQADLLAERDRLMQGA